MAPAIDPEAVRLAPVAKYRDAKNPTRAKQQQAYMKTTMAFWGISSGDVRKICRAVFVQFPVTTRDLWKRRTAILSQLTFKQDTDVDFLFATMRPSLERKEFWLRKAIGWALRAQASVDPAPILSFVREHRDELSGLTKREALKHFPQKVRASLL